MTDPRMPPAGSPLLNLPITGLAVIVVSGMWAAKTLLGAAHRAHVVWIATQARIQALGVRVGDSLDRMELGRIDEEEE